MISLGLPAFLEIIGLLIIYLYNLPRYGYYLIKSAYYKKRLPSYRYIFYIPKAIDKSVKLIGFITIIVTVSLIWLLNKG